ncbi:MAG TPA: hypothetical protein VK687_00345 [Bryobacteraceae bacterium]|nr:hypothetical protein [Bryobacteraceae bacterium]
MDGLKAYTPSKDGEMMDREGVAVSMLSAPRPACGSAIRRSYALSVAKTRCEFCHDSRADDAKRFTVEPVSLPWAQRP